MMSDLKRPIEVRLLPEAEEYFLSQNDRIQNKFLKIFEKVELGYRGDWFEKLKGSDGIFEFRYRDNQKFYRFFAFWDSSEKETLILGTHGFDKKSNEAPQQEIKKAEKVKRQYFELKTKNK